MIAVMDARYDRDFPAWAQDQAKRLRAAVMSGNNAPIDWLPPPAA